MPTSWVTEASLKARRGLVSGPILGSRGFVTRGIQLCPSLAFDVVHGDKKKDWGHGSVTWQQCVQSGKGTI